MKHFELKEFRGQHFWLTTGLLDALDNFREQLGYPVMISPVSGAIIRFSDDPKEFSDHLFGRGIDVMLPKGPSLHEAFNVARQVGFNAVGVYPYWKPFKGLHLGIRYPRDQRYSWADIGRPDPKTGKVKHLYVNIEQGFSLG